jgi:alanine dehydrogenase
MKEIMKNMEYVHIQEKQIVFKYIHIKYALKVCVVLDCIYKERCN